MHHIKNHEYSVGESFTKKLFHLVRSKAILYVLLLSGISAFCSEPLVKEYDDNGWRRVVGPREWSFPRDHGAHPDYKTEWWYLTGNLTSEQGNEFGFQWTLFRQGLRPIAKAPLNKWTVPGFYFGHFAITDIANNKFLYEERVERGAFEEAGSRMDKMEAWIGSWRLETVEGERYRLRASGKPGSIDLMLEPAKPLVLQGNQGVSQKSDKLGNASYYYSYTRLKTTGEIIVEGKKQKVSGFSWFDHEFSTSALGKNQVGWDWFALQLDSGEEIMLYGMRNSDGGWDSVSSGAYIQVDGTKRSLHHSDFIIKSTGEWRSPHKGAVYPSGWRIMIPSLTIDLTVKPALLNQELVLNKVGDISYWEGSCRIEGSRKGEAVKGRGYVELTGYASPIGRGMKE